MNYLINQKGFTLVEVLTVLVILSILVVIAVPVTQTINSNTKQNLFNSKINYAEKAAVFWGQDNKDCLKTTDPCSVLKYDTEEDSIQEYNITIASLAEQGYFEYDEEDEENNKVYIKDPRDESKCMNNINVTIMYDTINKIITANVKKDETAKINNCAEL